MRQNWIKSSAEKSGDRSEIKWVVATEEKVTPDFGRTDREASLVHTYTVKDKGEMGRRRDKESCVHAGCIIIAQLKLRFPTLFIVSVCSIN